MTNVRKSGGGPVDRHKYCAEDNCYYFKFTDSESKHFLSALTETYFYQLHFLFKEGYIAIISTNDEIRI